MIPAAYIGDAGFVVAPPLGGAGRQAVLSGSDCHAAYPSVTDWSLLLSSVLAWGAGSRGGPLITEELFLLG